MGRAATRRRFQMPRVGVLGVSIAGLAVIVAMIWAVPAGASRAANTTERQGLTNAVLSSSVGGLNKVPRSHYTVTGQRVSSKSKNWGIARLVATSAFKSSFQNSTVVAVKLAGTTRWVVVDVGTAQVGCGIAPNVVLADLFNTKRPCVGGIG
jgi:hypothetical protein